MNTPIEHRIPAEVLELFIDALGHDLNVHVYPNTSNTSLDQKPSSPISSRTGLTSLSLVSRAFRARAQHHLFSTLDFAGPPRHTSWDLIPRFDGFRRLVEPDLEGVDGEFGPRRASSDGQVRGVDSFGQQQALAQYGHGHGCGRGRGQTVGQACFHQPRPRPILTHLFHHVRTLRIAPDDSIFKAYVLLANENLVAIMRYIALFSPSFSRLSLSFMGLRPVTVNMLNFVPSFRSAFARLVRMDGLRTLEIDNVDGVSEGMLLRSRVKELRLRNVRTASGFLSTEVDAVSRADERSAAQLWLLKPAQLDSLSIDSSFIFPDPKKDRALASYSPTSHQELEAQKRFEEGVRDVRHLTYTSHTLFAADVPLIRNALLNLVNLHTLELSLDQLSCAFSSTFTLLHDPCDTSNGLAQVLAHPDIYLPELRALTVRLSQVISIRNWHPLVRLTGMLDALGSSHSSSSSPYSSSPFPSASTTDTDEFSSTPKLHRLTLGLSIYGTPPWTTRDHFFPERKAWNQLDRVLATGSPSPSPSSSSSSKSSPSESSLSATNTDTKKTGTSILSQIDSIHLDLSYRTVEACPWTFEERVFADRCLGFVGEAFPKLTAMAGQRSDSANVKRMTANVSVAIEAAPENV